MPASMYENRGGKVVAVITACSIVVTFIVGLRFYVRLGIIKKLGADDWVLAGALVCLPLHFLEQPSNGYFLGHNPILSYHVSGW
jgi:hypothetical protein